MTISFRKRPTQAHWKRRSLSFSKEEVDKVGFEDTVQIDVHDSSGNKLETVTVDGFIFANSTVPKKIVVDYSTDKWKTIFTIKV